MNKIIKKWKNSYKTMVVNVYEANNGELEKTNETITIKPRRWLNKNGISYPMKFTSPIAFENNNVYFLKIFDNGDKNSHGKHISLTFWQNQKFLYLQKKNWIQKEENIRYIINILFLIGGLTLGFFNYFK
jgi:hypothetical protein